MDVPVIQLIDQPRGRKEDLCPSLQFDAKTGMPSDMHLPISKMKQPILSYVQRNAAKYGRVAASFSEKRRDEHTCDAQSNI